MTQPDYNDGKWHGWNGGECPVHPESVVCAVTAEGDVIDYCAKEVAWYHDEDGGNVVAFRVIKPYVEPRKPREFWVNVYDDGGFGDLYSSADVAVGNASDNCKYRTVKLREVIEE